MHYQNKTGVITLLFLFGLCALPFAPKANAAASQTTDAQAEEAPTTNSMNRITQYVNIEVSWPTLGVKQDEAIDALVNSVVQGFEKTTLEDAKNYEEMKKEDPDFYPPRFPYECQVTFSRSAPLAEKSRVESIIWSIFTYTGGAHGATELIAHNFDMQNGMQLVLDDFFTNPKNALDIFSTISRRVLSETVLKELQNPNEDNSFLDEMLRDGTEPLPENFAVFCLIPNGVRIYFAQYQVAPYSAGILTVDISLDALQDAKPRMEYWQAL